jgi:fumarate hydratase subunit beta
MEKILKTPLSDKEIKDLTAGDLVYLSGTVYTARDAAHKRLTEMLEKNELLPFDFDGQAVFYAGPCPNKPGEIIGSIGPTTSGRMDTYAPALIKKGLKIMIGKGQRNDAVKAAIQKHKGIYFAAIGGAAALLSQCVKSVEIIAFEDLGTEAIRKLEVEKMPVVVAVDAQGGDVYRR